MKNHTADNFLKTNNYFVCASPLLAPFTQITGYRKRSKALIFQIVLEMMSLKVRHWDARHPN